VIVTVIYGLAAVTFCHQEGIMTMTFAAVLVLIAGLAPAQTGVTNAADDRAAIRQAVLDYAEGYYDHSPERMTRAISPLLTKRALTAPPGAQPFLTQMNAEMLIEATKGAAPRPSAAERRLVAEVLDVEGDTASARVFSVLFNDYIHLAKRDGAWRIVNVLWHAPEASAASDTASVERAARDYAAALAGTDGQRAASLLSPVAALRTLMSGPSGARVIREANAGMVTAAIASGQMPKGVDAAAVRVLGIDGDIASAKIGSGAGATYLHLARMNGQWSVVNTLTWMPPK
jgi:hypothetical protein